MRFLGSIWRTLLALLGKSTPANRAEGDVDRLIAETFFKDRRGVFVEVGAARPDFLSVSAGFRKNGWRVIAIEPIPHFCELQRRAGNEVLQYACGEEDRDDVDFTVVNSHGADYEGGKVSFESFSSLGIKENYRSLKPDLDTSVIKVRVRRLDTILRQHAPDVERIDILSIDVEGWELEVLNGLNFERHRPRVMVIENLFSTPQYETYAATRGYVLWHRAFPNEVYVDRELMTQAPAGG